MVKPMRFIITWQPRKKTVKEQMRAFQAAMEAKSVKEVAEEYGVPQTFVKKIARSDLHRLVLRTGVKVPQTGLGNG